MRCAPYFAPVVEEALASIHRSLAWRGWALASGMPAADDAFLLAFGQGLGEVGIVGNGDPGVPIYEVTARSADPSAAVSVTARAFDLHTDGSGMLQPPGIVVLACVVATPPGCGGESLLLSAEAVIDHLRTRAGDAAVAALAEPVHRTQVMLPSGAWAMRSVAITEHGPGGWGLRYRDSLVATLLTGKGLAPRNVRALAALREAVRSLEPTRVALNPGDVLVIDNRRTLHGRTAFDERHPRHLRRMKIYPPPSVDRVSFGSTP
jgi:alpha-ketoglutarate-dependent taurine dioxygenase